MVHTTGYMVYTAYTFKMFSIEEHIFFWCTADIGWITAG
jgi:acyl-coenzyme A synthetase/AMP-(fatty) acid ligase